ncbi:hypothetical protein HWV62_18492 [Athelia sp. TMB]|nr:hypothetical protein HWV62_18492 [Athelia sp. TMB]
MTTNDRGVSPKTVASTHTHEHPLVELASDESGPSGIDPRVNWRTESATTLYRWTGMYATSTTSHAATDQHTSWDGLSPSPHTSRPSLQLSTSHSPPPTPPVPPLLTSLTSTIIEPHPQSPTTSVFSVPSSTYTTVGRNSIATYMSTSHVPLRGGGLGLPPSLPVTPAQRERRRLRKKSRPQQSSFYGNVFEMAESPSRLNERDSSPESPQTSSVQEASPVSSPDPEVMPPPSPPVKATSRIGFLRRWGKRERETERVQPPSSATNVQRTPPSSGHRGWLLALWRA